MSITGKSIGFGIAPLEVFVDRVRSTESLLFRTAERKLGKEFRERGPRGKAINDNMQLYVAAPRAACFAVTLRVGNLAQMSLPGLSFGEQVIDEFLECLDLFTNGNEVKLKERINAEEYYRNFVGLAQNLEPDGLNVDMVGFTSVNRGATRQVALRRIRGEQPRLSPVDVLSRTNMNEKLNLETVELRGVLRMADSTKKNDQIEIVMEGNSRTRLMVPRGMMSDIVKPLWDTEVKVTGTRKGKSIHLIQIQPV